MNTERELKNIINELSNIYDGYDEDKYSSYYYGCFDSLKKFIDSKLNNPLLKKRNAKIFANHFDEILPYINQSNLDIIFVHFLDFINYKNFKEKFMEGIVKYPYKNEIGMLIYNIRVALHEKDDLYNKFVDKEMVAALIKSGADSETYIDILNYADEETQKEILNELIKNKINIYYRAIKYKGNNKQLIFENIDEYLKGSQNLYDLMKFVQEDDVILQKVKEYINNHEEQAINSVFTETKDLVKIKDDVIRDVITMVIKEVKEHETVNYADFKYKAGGFSRVLIAGNKVIKIGNRINTKFPNNPYILAPLMRKDLKTDKDSVFVEVTERVDTNELPSKEDLYQLYKKLRELGLVWTDIKAQNVGKLIHDNEIHWNKNLEPTDKTLEFDSSRGEEKLKKGDWVILDADFIYDENDKNINYANNDELRREFELRYKKEKDYNIDMESSTVQSEEYNKSR